MRNTNSVNGMRTSVEERTVAFKSWVDEMIILLEKRMNTDKNILDYRLYSQEPIHEELFEKKFQSEYFFIKEYMDEATWRSEEAGIAEDVLMEALQSFTQIKRKVRKMKSDYKKAFAELRKELMNKEELVMQKSDMVDEKQNSEFTVAVIDGRYLVTDNINHQIFLATLYIPDADMNEVLKNKIEQLSEIYRTYGSNITKKMEKAVDELNELKVHADVSQDEMRVIIRSLFDYSQEGIDTFTQMTIQLDVAGSFVYNLLKAMFNIQDVIRALECEYVTGESISSNHQDK